jgi:hypothetical protein
LVPISVKVTIGEGEKKVRDLQLGRSDFRATRCGAALKPDRTE